MNRRKERGTGIGRCKEVERRTEGGYDGVSVPVPRLCLDPEATEVASALGNRRGRRGI